MTIYTVKDEVKKINVFIDFDAYTKKYIVTRCAPGKILQVETKSNKKAHKIAMDFINN